MKRLIIFLVALIAPASGAWAQYDAQFSQYFMAMGYYNPGYAGTSDDLNVFGLQRQQWIGMPGAPTTSFINLEMPLSVGKTRTGVGVTLFTETIGLFNNSHLSGQLAFKRNLLGGTLSLGAQIGLASVSFDGTKAEFGDQDNYHVPEDEAIPKTQVSGMTLDINAGLYYTHKRFYAGIASTHLLKPLLELDENISTYIPRAFNLTGGYNIQLKNPLFELQPSVFLKTDLQSFQLDLTARVIYNKMFSGGLSWRGYEGIAMLGASFGNVTVGYAYDFPTGPLLKASSGSHELMVRYKLKLNKGKTGNYRHKSVRIL
ncbi:MAG: type IX secretion system membrane protein PorP/SprF [Tannerellaceae bacterium]|jgi:type IX secretion system PorP/SprF family membrane protein|nr:type IX secretion system membrane protein PorP/SprF [Tannerellaceae bacterium]